ncbi:hypothetical protein B0T18DRAFT_427221 [Schizothecium vesticola]|uniref:Uncharacterized protein n=1 Tax=Schizothecium vesticola TaxID=314040 RepID=A0AA40K883_9PEZI|nr:hypothetical protein B0T18DRAFT_427221 [Schizothecium vesticola]
MKPPLPLLALLPATTAFVTATTWTTSRIVSVLSPQYMFHPIYASVVTANATATVYALDCEDQFHVEPDAPLAGCAGFTSLQAVIRVVPSSSGVTEATFTATSTGRNGMRTISDDCTVDAVRMVCTHRLDGDTVPEEGKGDKVETMPVESGWAWASVRRFTVIGGLEYLPAETSTSTVVTTTGTTGPTTGSGGAGVPKETGTSGAGRRWEGMGAMGVGAMGVVVGLV